MENILEYEEVVKNINKISDSMLFLPLKKYLKDHPEILNYLQKIKSQYSFLHTEKDIIYFIKYGVKPYCKTCGKEIKYEKIRRGIRYCSAKCKAINPEVREKFKHTCIEKYGCENVAQVPEIYQKIRETDLEKYGCEHHLQNKEVIAKREQTNIKKYGVKNIWMLEDIRLKGKQTMLERYNVCYTGQSPELMSKTAATCQKRYGGNAPLSSKKIQNKVKKTCMEKYGFPNAKTLECWNNILSWKEHVIPLFNKEEFKGKTDKNKNRITYKWKCVECGNEFESTIYTTNHLRYLGSNFQSCPRCEHCYPHLDMGVSNCETELKTFCKEFYSNIIENSFSIIKPYELDIYIPEIKLAIEFNGIYYHSIKRKPLGYHLMKTEMCEKQGIRLIHIWEDEWVNDKANIKNTLKNIFEKSENFFNFTENELILNRGWYNRDIVIPGYKLTKITEPQLIQRREFLVEDCGCLVYEKE